MKKIILIFSLLILFWADKSNAQIYNINSARNGTTVTTCKGQVVSSAYDFTDPFLTGNTNGYANNENYTVTFCSGTGGPIRANFYFVDLEAGFDFLYVYDGPTTASPLLATLSGVVVYPGVFTSSGTCLTFKFVSDGSNRAGGFRAFLGCTPQACGANAIASDVCTSAPTICNLNGYCGSTSGWYTRDNGATLEGGAFSCATIQNNSWLAFTASATSASFNITSSNCSDPSRGIQAVVVSTSNCTSFTAKSTCQGNGVGTFGITATGLTIGTTYYIVVDGVDGNDCDYSIQAQSGVQTVSVTPSGGVTTYCSGQSLTLNASVVGTGPFTYTWSPAPVSGQGTATATYTASATTYSATITGACGASQVATFTPTINAPPTVSVAGNTPICSGGAGVSLTASTSSGASSISFSNNTTSPIPDNNATGVTSNINVTGISGTVGTQLQSVCLNISHGFDGDLDISLRCPNGTIIDLSSGNGGAGDNYTNTCFSGGAAITGGTAPFTGSFSPEQALSLLSGCTANGTWSLIVKDHAAADVGTLVSWTLTFQNTTTYSWAPSTGLSSSTGATVTANPGSTTTYTVTASDNVGCSGTGTVVVTVNAAPTMTSAATTSICSGSALAFSLTSSAASSFSWVAADNANTTGESLTNQSGSTINNTITNNTTTAQTVNYTVTPTSTSGGCVGTSQSVAVTVNPKPIMTSATTATVCSNTALGISLTSGASATYSWIAGNNTNTSGESTSAQSGSTINDVIIDNVTTTQTVTYTVTPTSTVGGCAGNTQTVTVTVNPKPVMNPAGPVTICSGVALNIPLSSNVASSIVWVAADNVNTTGESTANQTSATINNTITNSTASAQTVNYTVTPTATTGSCIGTPITVVVNVNPKDNASFTYPSSTFCTTGTDPAATITGLAGGTFSSSPAGLSLNTSTGLIDLSASTAPATYTVTYQTNGACPNSSSISVNITNSTNSTFTYASGSYCQGAGNPNPVFSAGASAGTFTSSAGLIFVNANTGQINLNGSTPGTYNVVNTITGTGGCATSTSAPFTVTINGSPTMTSSNTATVCSGVALNIPLTSSIASSYSWVATDNTNTTGESLTNQTATSITNTILNSTSSAQTVSYAVTPTSTVGGCPGATQTVNVTVNPPPTMTSANTASVCSGVPLNIGLTSNIASSYSWIAADNVNTSGESTSAQATATINNSITNTSGASQNVIYTVTPTSTAGSCAGTPQTVTVTVNSAPVMTNANTATVCSGLPLSIGLTSNIGASYSWVAVDNVNTTGESTTAQVTSTINNTITNTTTSNQTVTYNVTPTSTAGSCAGGVQTINVTVTPAPNMTSSATATVCSGTAINIPLTSNVASTYTWIAADNVNTTGESTTSQSTGTINNTITNTTGVNQLISYTVVPTATSGSCAGTPQTVTVTVNPAPVMTSSNSQTVCSGALFNIPLTSNVASNYTWIAGDNVNTNGESTTSQTSNAINNTVNNGTAVPQIVTYTVTATSVSGSCAISSPQIVTVTINPLPSMTSASAATVCSGVALNIALTSNVPSTYSWIAVDNANTTGETYTTPSASSTLNDAITNITSSVQTVTYAVTAISTSSSCVSNTPQSVTITVNPAPFMTNANTATVCSGTALNIPLTSSVASTYTWIASDNPNTTGESLTSQSTGNVNNTIINSNGTTELVIYTVVPTASSGSCAGVPQTLTVTVNPAPDMTSAATATVCSGVALNIVLTSDVPSAYSWIASNNVNTTGESTVAQSTNTINNTILNSSGAAQTVSYTVTPTSTAGTCLGTPQTVTVTVNPAPTMSSASAATVCSNVALNIPLSSNLPSSYSWLATDNTNTTGETTSASSAGTITDIIQNTTNAVQTVTYSVTATSTANSCASLPQTVTVTVNPAPTMNSTNTALVCSGTALNIALTSVVGSSYTWIASNNASTTGESTTLQTTALINNSIVNTSGVNQIVTYTVTPTSTVGTCTGSTQTVTVTVKPAPVMTSATTGTVCSGVALNIPLTSDIASGYSWIATDNVNTTGESLAAQGTATINNTLTNSTTSAQVVTYSVTPTSTLGGCSGAPQTVTVTVNPAPVMSSSNAATVCSGTPLNIPLASNIPSSFTWIAADNANTTGESTTSQSTNTINNSIINNTATSQTVIYTVTPTSTANSCTATTPQTVTVTVNPMDNATFTYPGSTFCQSGANPPATITGLTGGSFSATPAGLSLNAASGGINLAASSLGTYAVVYQTNGTCPNTYTLNITISTAPSATFSYTTPLCSSSANPFPSFSGSGSGGVFSSSAGLVINSSTGEVNLAASTPGSYTVTNTIAASGGCAAAVANAPIDIGQAAIVDAGLPASVCQGSSITLNGTMGGSASFITWTATNGSIGFSDDISLTSTYTPTAADVASGTITLTITTNNPSGICPAVTDNVLITVNPKDNAAFNYTSGTSYCQSGTDPIATITGTSGGTFSSTAGLVLDGTTGGIDLSASTAGPYVVTYTTGGICPAISTSNITIGQEAIVDAGTVTPVCEGSPITLNGTSGGSTTSTTWSATNGNAGFGNVNSLTSTYTPTSADALAGTITLTVTTNDPAGVCPVATDNVVLTVNPLDNATFNYTTGLTYCQSGTDPLATITGTSGGTFSSTPGLVIDPSTGLVDLSASTLGTYTVTYTTAGICSATSTKTITITNAPSATFSFTSGQTVFCKSDTDPTLVFGAGSSAGNFSATPAGLTINSSGQIVLSTSTPGTYEIYNDITAAGGCARSIDSLSITVNAEDDATFNYVGGSNFCQSGTDPVVNVTGTPGGTFSSSPGLVVNINTGVIDVSASTVGTYSVKYLTYGLCPDSSTVSVTINAAPSPTFTMSSGTTSFCSSGTNPFAVFSTGVSAGSFTVSPSGLVFQDVTTGEINLSGSTPGTYQLYNTLVASGGCATSVDSLSITINQAATSSAGVDTAICAGTSYLTSNGSIGGSASTSAWTSAGTGSFTNSSSANGATYLFSAADSTAGAVTLYLTTDDPAGTCAAVVDSMVLTITPLPAPVSITPPPSYCAGSTVGPIFTTNSGGTITWYSDAALSNVVGTGSSLNPPAGITSFWVTETSTAGCTSSSAQVTINFNPLPVVDTTNAILTTANCGNATGSITNVTVVSGQSPFTYSWQDASGNVVGTSIDLLNVGQGVYSLTVTDNNGCITTTSGGQSLTVTASNGVVASFTPSAITGETPLVVTFTNTSTGATNYLWQFGTGDTSTVTSPQYTFNQIGNYTVCLIASNASGCSDTACSNPDSLINVFINSVFVIPNVFTPNGDESNDIFGVESVGLKTLDAEVYNRWGEKLFEWHTTNGGWDGRTASGVLAPDGTYFCIINAKGLDGKTYFEKRSFSLIR